MHQTVQCHHLAPVWSRCTLIMMVTKKHKAKDMQAESILLDGAARPTDSEENVNVVEELQDATSFDEIVQFIPINYLEYIYPLMEDLAFTARLAWISEKSLREQQEHRENGTLPYGISATKPLFVCGQQYSANICKRYLDIIIGCKEANMKQWQRRLAPETWAPQWKQVVTSAWQTCLSQLNMTPNIMMQLGVEKLIGWRPSDESKENLQQVLNDIEAIGRQVIAVERMKCTLWAEKRELKEKVQSTMIGTEGATLPVRLGWWEFSDDHRPSAQLIDELCKDYQ
ncbi:hypothetical protein EDC04DRAFT_2600315 [Pisolithus marmoratus]|nr:hypothetical protein EDC04DRAFT_2600315 [Pisolithus marmoratus]